jgi:hypothetical protein
MVKILSEGDPGLNVKVRLATRADQSAAGAALGEPM